MTAAVKTRQGASPLVWLGLIVLGLFVFLFAFSTRNDPNIGGYGDPDGVGPNGMLAARLFVEEAGGRTQRNVGLPDDDIDVAILTGLLAPQPPFGADDTIVESWQPLLDWVRVGGTLLTTFEVPGGPESSSSFVDDEFGDNVLARGECTDPLLDGVNEVRPLDYVPLLAGTADTYCFGTVDNTLIASTEFGDGRVVRVGTMAMFFNRALDDADNAPLFANLIEIDDEPTVGFLPEAPIWFVLDEDADIEIDGSDADSFGDNPPLALDADGEPIPFNSGGSFGGGSGGGPVDEDGNPVGAGEKTLLDLIDPTVLALIAGLTAAAILYGITVGRRHGSPISEPVPIELPSSSYVDAVGRLYGRAANANDRSLSILRQDLRTDLARRVGMSSDASAQEIASALVSSDQQAAVVHLLDGPPPANDDEFVALTTQLIQTRDRVDRSGVAILASSEDISLS